MKPTEQIPSEMLAAAKEAAAAKGYCSKWGAEKIAEAALEAAGVPALLAQIASMQAWRDAESGDRAALLARIAELEVIIRQGYELSTWAACINWRGGENQKEWLDELREKIEAFQSLAELICKAVRAREAVQRS